MLAVKDILSAALELDPEERMGLVEELSASLDPSWLGAEWEAEIKARLDDVDSGRVKPVPADNVFERMEFRFGGR
jgi:putative addiction module component (TIGR02574 family)